MKDDEDDIRKLSDEIMHYLDNHPYAADTLDGLMQWWLSKESGLNMRYKIEASVESLLKQGLINEFELADGTKIYKRWNRAP